MNRRTLPFVMALLSLVGILEPAHGAVLCSIQGGLLDGLVFEREQCRAREQQLDPAAVGFGVQVIFRDVQRDAVLGPGERLSVPAACGAGEVVISGGYNFDPTSALKVTTNVAFFDGVHSGWLVDFVNSGDAPALFFVRVGLQCTKGTGVGQ
ncbi:MAG: hypothetical protein E6H80_11075 [Betaproteobacteria bacterium]|nr:MAG: hypothetical protein E6H80_11075 [Betaproteobacteria bacterium]